MQHKLLREYIELLLLAESPEHEKQLVGADDLKKMVHNNDELLDPSEVDNLYIDDLRHVLKKLGIKLIPSSKSEIGYIDAGAYGAVFEVLYKKKRAAMKITSTSGDAYSYERLFRMQDKLPNFVKRSLPKIYEFTKIKLGGTTQYVTIMEFLQPLSKSFKDYFYDAFPWGGRAHPGQKTPFTMFEDPRLNHLLLSLRWLTQHGFLHRWEDVHDDNVLLRPSTGDIVVADVGMFDWG